MQKIKSLLEESGLKSEVADKICTALETHKTQLRETLEADYKAKVEAAKKICVEETEHHKAELARRLAIFCEAKSAAIEALLQKQSANHDTAATTKLRQMRALLDNVQLESAVNGESEATIKKLKGQVAKLTTENKEIVAKANKQTAIAERVLKRNRELEAVSRNGNTVSESRRPNERPPRRLDQNRQRANRPVTDRPTLVEHQTRQAPRPVERRPDPSFGTFSIDTVAETMEADI